ncbi:hypothetical protein EZV62_008703 [Acer yangbiense]|uniref:Uncharacterized protein n=1 Tax=Acer yangbiense TaxID=1000413 RepID=A0A5C7IED8_9ROSI|nr:hypothetical protein EZV62_008703 [Acer yangbiense]
MSKTSNIHLHPRAFVNMQKLRFLQFYVSNYCENNKVYLSQGLEYIFTQLRYLHWYGCPLKSLQSNFHSKNLVILEMLNSNIKELWSGVQQLDNLKTIDLRESKHLIRCPDFSGTPNLEKLLLGLCQSLIGIPQSIQYLNKLKSLDVQGCENITSIPELPNNVRNLTLGDTSIEELPSSFEDLCRLQMLELDDCSRLKSLPSSVCKWKSLLTLSLNNCSKIDKFPNDIGTLESLIEIQAVGTAIREVPSSISYLKSLRSLSFSGCKGEDGVGLLLPPLLGFHKLNSLNLSDCGITELPDNIGCLTSLERLYLGRNNFESIPESIINLSNLEFLDISYCQRIKVLPKFRYWINIFAVNCTSLEELSCPSFFDSALHYERTGADFINCFKLNRNLLNNFVNDTLLNLLNIQLGLAAPVKRRYHRQICFTPSLHFRYDGTFFFFLGVYQGAQLCVCMCYPGTEIPECFNIRSGGSSINVNLPPDCSNYNFLCFALCVVLRIPDPNHQCDQHRDCGSRYVSVTYECNIKSKDGDRRVELFKPFGHPGSSFWVLDSGLDCIRSNHVIIGFGFRFFRELCDNEFSFQFYVENKIGSNIEQCKLEKCAVRLMFGLHLETSDECGKEDGPHLEEFDKEDEPCPMRLNAEYEEENGQHLEESNEEDEPHPKRLKHME